MKIGWVYIISCSDKSFYTGSTSNLDRRMYKHEHNLLKCYTNSRHPLKLVFHQDFENIEDAIRAERQIKGWTRKKKESLIDGNHELLHKLSRCTNSTNSDNK